jgi:hypothetical protein
MSIMKLVDRYTLKPVRDLTSPEKNALADLYLKVEGGLAANAHDIITAARINDQYFVCECTPFHPASPTLSSRLVSENNYALYNLSGRHQHAPECSFHYRSNTTLDKGGASQHGLGALVYTDNNRIKVNQDQLSVLYRTLITNTQLNRLTSKSVKNAESFRSKLIDGCRLSSVFAKQGISKKIRFGINQYQAVTKEIRENDAIEWLILVSLIDGFDGQNIVKESSPGSAFKIPAGEVVSLPLSTFGPMVATTIIAKKGSTVFSLASAIDSVYENDLPVVISCNEDRAIITELIVGRSLLDWIDNKQSQANSEPTFVDVHCLPTSSPITKRKTTPRFTIGRQGAKVLVADPTKEDRGFYDEQGVLLWHRQFSHIPAKSIKELKAFKSKLAAIFMKID